MFRRILVPLDLGRGNDETVRIAATLARERSARLTLLHIIARLERIPQAELQEFYDRLERAAHRKLGRHARSVGGDVDVEVVVRVGEPATDILRQAQTKRTDLIVLRSHQVEAARGPKGLGTTSYRIAIMARCPVLLVK